MKLTPILLILIFAATILRAESQLSEPGRVYFYSESDFRGPLLEVDAGEEKSNLQYDRDNRGTRWNDRISSFRIEGPVRVIVYNDANFRGESREFSRSVRNLDDVKRGASGLESWNDRISSLRVIPMGREFERVQPFREMREADHAIRTAYREYLGREPDPAGLSRYRRRLMEDGWTQEELRRAICESAEFRERDVDAIVRRAYRSELGRDPDSIGLAGYVRAAREHGWTEDELRSELRKSSEGREHVARAIIIAAYRDLLGREPDKEGMDHYLPELRDHGWTEEHLREALRRSDEYRKQGKGKVRGAE